VQPFHEIDVHARTAGPYRQDDSLVYLVADLSHYRNGDVMHVTLATSYVGESHQLKAEAIFPTQLIPFAETTFGQAAENTKDGCFRETHRLHDLG
jgi:hypothetical protein